MAMNKSLADLPPEGVNFTLSEEYIVMLRMRDSMTQASKVFEIAIPVTIATILVIGLLGNLMVIFVTLMTQRIIKHPVHSMLVLNLAIADIMYLTVNAPYYIVSNISHKWTFSEAYCPFFYFASNTSMAAGIFTMCSLAWMRFMALMHPFKFQKSVLPTRTGGLVVISLNWIAALIVALPNAIHFRLGEVPPSNRTQCIWEDKNSEDVYVVVLLVFTYVVPFVLVTVFYILIGREVLCLMMRKTQRGGHGPSERQAKAEYRKTTIMVLFLIVAFLICWFPHHLFLVMVMSKNFASYRYGALRYTLKMVARCMSYAHACVNPIIYTFAAPDFRRSLCVSLTKPCQRSDAFHPINMCTVKHTQTGSVKKQRGKGAAALMLPNTNNSHALDRTLVSKLSSPISPRAPLPDMYKAESV